MYVVFVTVKGLRTEEESMIFKTRVWRDLISSLGKKNATRQRMNGGGNPGDA